MRKGPQIILTITLSFVFLITGIFVGRNTISGTLTVETTKQSANTTTDATEDNGLKNGKININKAGIEELSLLPGIGETLAIRIVAYRNTNGNFESIEDIMNVSGIGEGTMSQIEKYITVDEE